MERQPQNARAAARRRHPAAVAALVLATLAGLFGLAPATAEAAEAPTVIRWWLLDADTDARIMELTDYQRLILPVLPDKLSIEAEANGETESVSMRIEGVESALENYAPYTLAGDPYGDVTPVPALGNPGWVTVSATPYAADSGGGTVGLEAKLRLYLHEPTFIVTHPDDSGDTNPGDGVCIPTHIDDGFDFTWMPAKELPIDVLRPVDDLRVSITEATAEKIELTRASEATTRIDRTTIVGRADQPAVIGESDWQLVTPDFDWPVLEVDPDLDLTFPEIEPGPCTLRAAIEEANALPGRQSILVLSGVGPFELEHGHLVVSDGVDIEGHGRAVIDAGERSRIFYLTGDHLVNMRSLELTNGSPGPSDRGGAIWIDNDTHLQLTDSIVRNSRANYGGGIYLQNGGDLTMRSTAVRDNIAGTPDDGITGGGVTQRGGGIYNLKGVVKIIDSSVFHNLAVRGGGLSNVGGTMRIENSSVIDNEALAIAGGIENHHAGDDKGNLHLAFATVANNQAGTSNAPPPSHRVGGGLYNTGWAYMASSILADNTDGWSAGDPLHAPDCHSPDTYDFKSYRNNVVGVLNGNCDFGDYSSGTTAWIDHGSEGAPLNPGLTGFSTWGHLGYRNLTVSSVALDGGASQSASLYPCADHDMRDRQRPVGGGCDIGAVERQ